MSITRTYIDVFREQGNLAIDQRGRVYLVSLNDDGDKQYDENDYCQYTDCDWDDYEYLIELFCDCLRPGYDAI